MHQYTTVHTIQVQQCTHMNMLFSHGREFSLIEHRAHTRLSTKGNVIVKSTDQRQTLELVGTVLKHWALRNSTSWDSYVSQSLRL